MIPIVSIFDLINALFSAIISVRVYITYKKTHDIAVFYFFMFFLFFTIFWISAASPNILLFNPKAITISNILAYIVAYISYAFIVQIPFIFIEKRWVAHIISVFIIIAGIIFIIGRIYNFELSKIEIFYPYMYWKPVYPVWMRIMTGIVSSFSAIIFTIVFFQFGFKNKKNKIVFNKAMYLASGMLALFVAALISFIFSPQAGFLGMSMSAFSGILGLWLLLQGILYDERHQNLTQTPNEKTF